MLWATDLIHQMPPRYHVMLEERAIVTCTQPVVHAYRAATRPTKVGVPRRGLRHAKCVKSSSPKVRLTCVSQSAFDLRLQSACKCYNTFEKCCQCHKNPHKNADVFECLTFEKYVVFNI